MAKEESVRAGSFFDGKRKGRVRMEKFERGPPDMKGEDVNKYIKLK